LTVRKLPLVLSGMLGIAAQANEWVNLGNITPGTLAGQALAYDAESRRVIMYGDETQINQTWAYNAATNVWTATSPASPPPTRSHTSMMYDAESDRVIVFGGVIPGMGSTDETWAYNFNTNTWTNMNPPTRPPIRNSASFAYAAGCDRGILFGGFPLTNQVWAYDFNTNTWQQRASGPPSALRTGMAYDSARDRVVLWTQQAETWSYDCAANQWTRLNTTGPPDPGAGPVVLMAHDIQSDRSVLFHETPTTWAFDFDANLWTSMNPPVSPTASHAGMTYVSHQDRIILYGGGSQHRETWAYALAGTPPAVPDGGGGTPLLVGKAALGGTSLTLSWDTATCNGAVSHQILWGSGSQLPSAPGGTYSLGGSACAIGTTSPFTWTATPNPVPGAGGWIWFLVVATDGASVEGSWGRDARDMERNGAGASGSSGQCGMTTKSLTNACGQ